MGVGLLTSCTSGEEQSSDPRSGAYEAGRRSAQAELERFGRPPETDECATAFENQVTLGLEEASDRTDWVAGCLHVQL